MSSDRPPAPIVEAETFESTPSTSDPTFKYYQIAVPSFSFNQTGDDTGVTRTVANVPGDPTAGSSFIRLGAFPDVTNPSMGPAGFAASLALANLVGEATAISAAESTDASPSTLGGDPNYLLGFADDTRVHKAPLPPNQGQAETLLLLTKGGWWEHSDGNRISTTAGDRIDIIQGNYKMVVIGRQPTTPTPLNAAAMSINDISGGLQEVNGPGATPVIRTTEWTEDQGGVWTVYQDNGIGNVVTSSYGSSCTIAAGPLLETWTGLAPPGFPQSEAYTNSQTQRGTEAPAGVPDAAPYGVVNSYTWAESITSYVGSEQMLIPVINAYTFATTMLAATGSATYPVTTLTSTTFADTMLTAVGSVEAPVTTLTSTTFADTMLTVTGTAAAPVATMTSTTFAGVSNAITTAEAVTAVTTAAAVTNVTTAAAVTNVTTAAALTTVNLAGNNATVNAGALIELINVAGENLTINLGNQLTISVPDGTTLGPVQVKQHLQHIQTEISNLHTSVQHVHSALVHEIVAAAVFLGLP